MAESKEPEPLAECYDCGRKLRPEGVNWLSGEKYCDACAYMHDGPEDLGDDFEGFDDD